MSTQETTHDHDGHADDGAVHVHVHPQKLYVGVFIALVTLTLITVLTSRPNAFGIPIPDPDFDGWTGGSGINLGLAMVIATIKATLVCTFFMHLKDDNRFNALVFVGSVLFAGVFLAYTMNDTAYRGHTGDPFQGVAVSPLTGERAPGGITTAFHGEEPEAGIDAPVEAPAAEHAEGEAAAEHH
jgi:cytochrome c oxidase subunit IV